MAYARGNPKTKKMLKEWIKEGRKVRVFQPGPFGPDAPTDGTVSLEGPHYPKPHRWYATGTMEGGVLVKIS